MVDDERTEDDERRRLKIMKIDDEEGGRRRGATYQKSAAGVFQVSVHGPHKLGIIINGSESGHRVFGSRKPPNVYHRSLDSSSYE